jgi:hypothetical protein
MEAIKATGVPENVLVRHRTVLEIRDKKWALVIKLVVGGTRTVIDIDELRNDIQSKTTGLGSVIDENNIAI